MSPPVYVYIGGGAAGYFGAINGADRHPNARHILLEGTHRPMTKIRLSGGGRCNVTHSCFDPHLLVKNYPRGSKELLSAFTRFQPRDTIAWFARRGVTLKTEPDGRMFPITDRSDTIIGCFNTEAERCRVEVRKGALVRNIERMLKGFRITLHNNTCIDANRVLLATGSFPGGYELAASLGHRIISPSPSLFTFNCSHPILKDMMGVSFKHVTMTLTIADVRVGAMKEQCWQQTGPLLITHWGLSGPAVLKLSAFAARELHAAQYQAELRINWLGVTSFDSVMDHLTELKRDQGTKTVSATPLYGLTKRFYQQLVAGSLLEKQHWTWADLTKNDLRTLALTLTASVLAVEGKGEFKEEFVSCGGVDLREINFKTMESKVCPGLFLAGEILNVDGITGGFNFQNAWTTSWIVAQNIGSDHSC